jgi:long-chain fatty acid transport protein
MHASFHTCGRRPKSPLRIFLGVLVAAALVAESICGPAGSGRAYASGYALREQSGSALGNAFAGATAGAEDLSYMYFNPAALTRQSKTQVAPVVTAILPRLKMRDVRGDTAAGTPISGNNGGRNATEEHVVAALYGLLDLQDAFELEQKIKFGIGVNVPFGVETDYRDGWIGRYHALHSKVLALNVNPALAWEITPGISLAAGLQVQYITARVTNAIDMGSIGASRGIPGSVPGAQDGRGKVSGNDVGYGFTLGALFEPWTGTRVGVGYRSSIEHDLEGDANFELGGSAVARALAARTGLFQDTGAKAHVVTPETVSLGIHQELSPRWAVMGEAQWTRWSRFDHLTVKFDNPAQPDSVTDENWSDSWFIAVGFTWKPDDTWTLRGGAAWDQDPTRDRRRTPRIPTDDRYWIALGAGWRPSASLTFDLGYTHIFLADAPINLARNQPGNEARGNLSGNAEGGVDIIALQLRWAL